MIKITCEVVQDGHTSTSKPSVNARTKSAARCNAPISVVSLQVYTTPNVLMNCAGKRQL